MIIKQTLWTAAGLIVVFVFIASHNDKAPPATSTSTSTSTSTAPSMPPPPRPLTARERRDALIPQAERGLVNAVIAGRRQYAAGANEMQKGAARPMRARAVCALMPNEAVRNWVGLVTMLSTNGDGNGVLGVEIGADTYLKTWNNSLSDIGTHTLIDAGSPLFAMASALHKGQLVEFSGLFFADSTDCIRESSLTLRGSIDAPEYIFRFQTIAPVDR